METPKKKILFVITKSNWGGAQRYVYDLALSLDKSTFDVSVIAGGNGLLAEKLQSADIAVTSLDSMQRDVNLKKEFLSALELFKIFRKTKPDLVHLNSSKAGGLGALAARLAGVKNIIFTAHAWAFNENRGTLSKMFISFLHWMTVILSHRTIAVSDSVKEQVIHMPFMKNKIEVIHLGMDTYDFKEKEEARVSLRVKKNSNSNLNLNEAEPENDIWVGTISELHPVKGIPYAIDAIALIRDERPELNIKFYIIGEGEQRALIEKQIVKRRLESRVFLTGFIDEAKTYLKAFDIFTLSSLSEAFGYSILEAGLAGVPVIATEVGGIPEVIDEAGILIQPKSGRALAEAIKKLIDFPDERERLSKELTERVQTIFSKAEMCSKSLDVYLNKR
jgi:glycosyltransferase involved in cell wall biosynthesis